MTNCPYEEYNNYLDELAFQPDLFDMPTITCDGSCENPKDCIEKKICAQKCNKELPKIVKEQKLICDLTYEDYKPGIEKVMPSLSR